MTVRSIISGPTTENAVGWKSNKSISEYTGTVSNHAVSELAKVVIYPDHLGFMMAIGLKLIPKVGRPSCLTLTPATAMELVKAILQNYDGSYLMADKELVNIIAQKTGEFASSANRPGVVTVTPEVAAGLLESPSTLRELNPDNIKGFAKDMEREDTARR